MRFFTLFSKISLLIAGFAFFGCKENPPADPITNTKAFPQSAYQKAIAYHYDDKENMGKIIDRQGKLNPNVIKQTELQPAQIEQLTSLLNNKDTYSNESARCFHPRLGVVFYDQNSKAVAHISICFQCNNYASSSAIPVTGEGSQKLTGFSVLGKEELQKFCRSLGFGDC